MELERKKATLIRVAYYGVIALAVLLTIRYLWKLALPFLLGFLIAYLLRPLVGFLCRHSKIGRRGAAIVSAIVFYALIAALVWLAGTMVYIWSQNAGATLPRLYEESIRPILQELGNRTMRLVGRFSPVMGADTGQVFESLSQALEEIFVSVSTGAAGVATDFLGALPMLALTTIFTILSSVLICVDYDDVTGLLLRQIPERLHSTVFQVRDFLATTVLKIVKAYLILMVITFAELALGLWLLGVKSFWGTAAIIAVLDLLPVLGSGAILIPWGIWSLISGNYLVGGGMLLLWAAVSFVRQILEPRIVGGQIGLHPLVTLTAMYCGLRLAGFGGLILAPVTCLLLKYLYDNGIIRYSK